MTKKVFKGWISKDFDIKKGNIDGFFWNVCQHRNIKTDWPEGEWGPLSV
jgi:hypothetical protein